VEVSGQLHALTTLQHLIGCWVGLKEMWMFREEKNVLPMSDIEPQIIQPGHSTSYTTPAHKTSESTILDRS
jgi:hypothetical protein